MENQGINLLIKDFYAKYDPESYSEEKVKSVIDFYKGDHELIIKDFYAKYDPDAYSEEKVLQVSDFYGLKKKGSSDSDSLLQEDTTTSAIPSEGRLTTDTSFYKPIVPFDQLVQPQSVTKQAFETLTPQRKGINFREESQKIQKEADSQTLEQRLGKDAPIEDLSDRALYNTILSTFLPRSIKGMEEDVFNYLKENPKEADKISKKEGKISEAEKFEMLSKIKESKLERLSLELNELKDRGVMDLMESQASNFSRLDKLQSQITGLTSQIKDIENKYLKKNGFDNIAQQLKSLEAILSDPSKQTPELINRYNSLSEQHNQIIEKLGATEYGQLVEQYKSLSGEYNLLTEATNQVTELNKDDFGLVRDLFGQYESGLKEYNELSGYFPRVREIQARQEAFNATVASLPPVVRQSTDFALRSINSLYDFATTVVFKSGAQIASAIGDVTMPGSYKLSDQYLDWYEKKFTTPFATRTDIFDIDEETGKYKHPVSRITGMVGDQVGLFVGLALMGKYAPVGQSSNAAMSTNYLSHLNKLKTIARQSEIARTTIPMFMATFDEHYKMGEEHGFDGAGKLLYGTAMAAIEGLSELIMPNYKILFGKGARRTALQATVRESVQKNWTLGQIVKANVHNILAESTEEMAVEAGEIFATLIGSLVSDDIEVSIPSVQEIIDIVLVTSILTGVGGFAGTVKDAKRTKAYMKYQLAMNSEASFDTINEYVEQGLITQKQADNLITDIQQTQYLLGEIPESLSPEKKAAIIEKKNEINMLLGEAIINEDASMQRVIENNIKKIEGEIQQIIADPNFDTKYNEEMNNEINESRETQPQIPQRVADKILSESKVPGTHRLRAISEGFSFSRVGKAEVELKNKEDVERAREELSRDSDAINNELYKRRAEAEKDSEMAAEFPYRLLDQRFKTKEEFITAVEQKSREGLDPQTLESSDDVMLGDVTQSEITSIALKAAEQANVDIGTEAKIELTSSNELGSRVERNSEAGRVLDNVDTYFDTPNKFAEPTEKGAIVEQKQNNTKKQQEITKGTEVVIRRGDETTADGVVKTVGLNQDGSKNFVVEHADGTDTVNADDIISWQSKDTQTKQATPTILLPVLFQLSEALSNVKKGLGGLKVTDMRNAIKDYIDKNARELSKLTGISVPALLKSVNGVKTLKGAEKVIAQMEAAIKRQNKKSAVQAARDFIKKISGIKLTKKVSGRKQAANLLQDDIALRDKVARITEMSKEQAENAKKVTEDTIEALWEMRDEGTLTKEQLTELSNAELELILLDTYGNLEGKTAQEVQYAINQWNDTFKQMRQDFKGWQEVEKKRRKEIRDGVSYEVAGSRELAREARQRPDIQKTGFLADVKKFAQRYQSMMGSIASLTHAIWGGYRSGQRASDFFKSRLYNMYKALDRGLSERIAMQNRMKSVVQRMGEKYFGSLRSMAKAMNKNMMVDITFEVKNEKGEVTSTETRSVEVRTETAAHLWASYLSESNNPYLNRIQHNNRTYKLSEASFNKISQELSQEVKDFTNELIRDYFGNEEYFNQADDIYFSRTGRRMTRLPDYIPVVARSRNQRLSDGADVMNFGVFRAFTKERLGGDYDLRGNGIYKSAMKYADDMSMFVHVAQPISDLVYTLNSNDVMAVAKDRGVEDKVRRIIDRAQSLYNERAVSDSQILDWFMRRFVKTKILTNFNLVPKQWTSVITMLDADFGSPLGVLTEFVRYSTFTADKKIIKEIKELVRNHPDLRYRMTVDIESLTQSEKRQINPYMFGESRSQVAAGLLLTAAYNPTQVGDRMAIEWGGIPVALYNYKVGLKEAVANGHDINSVDAKAWAAQKAADALAEFINTTQQSAKGTHRSGFQQGGWRTASAFMNAIMGYARKVTRHSRDIGRDFYAARKRHMAEGDSRYIASAKAFGAIRPAKIQSLFIYTSVLPVLFSTVSSGGGNIARLFSDDDDERDRARARLIFDATLGWTKGLFGVGFILEYMMGELTGGSYGKRSDNIVRTLDDTLDLLDSFVNVWRAISKYNDSTIETAPKYERDLYHAWTKLGISGVGLRYGAPTTFLNRVADIVYDTKYDEGVYDDMLAKVARIYGLPKEEIKRIFDESWELK